MKKTVYASLLLLGSLHLSPVLADEQKAEKQAAETQAVQPKVDANIAKQSAEERQKIVSEAVEAVADTEKALLALDANKKDEALKLLEKVTGKLEIILAREPDLALAPIDISEVSYDLYADLDTIKKAIKEADDALDDGEVQKARHLIAGLASEIIIRTTSLPMVSYPAAIQAIVPLIDQGKIDEAKFALVELLNTLVVTEEIIPLPLLRAELLLAEAEILSEKEKRSEDENKTLKGILDAAHHQLRMAELLGYGKKSDFKAMYDQIDEIKDKSSGGKSGKGWFDKIKQKLASFKS